MNFAKYPGDSKMLLMWFYWPLALFGQYKKYKRKITAGKIAMGQELGKKKLFEHVDALLVSGNGWDYVWIQLIFLQQRYFYFFDLFVHLKVRVRAPRPTVMRRREPAQIPLLPLAVDLVHFPAEMEVQQGVEIEMIWRSRSKRRRRRRRASKMMKRGRRISGLLLHEANLGLLRIQKRNPRRGWLPSR
jgi:hypothetical protein